MVKAKTKPTKLAKVESVVLVDLLSDYAAITRFLRWLDMEKIELIAKDLSDVGSDHELAARFAADSRIERAALEAALAAAVDDSDC